MSQQYRAVFEAVADGLIISDLADGRTADVNPALCRMQGCQHDELIGLLSAKLIPAIIRCSPSTPAA